MKGAAHLVGVELGVARGSYSTKLVRHFARLYLVDKWDDHHDPAEMAEVEAMFHPEIASGRVQVRRATFAAAAREFSADFFDFIYIDGYAHTGQEAGETLRQWWPKLKHGGVFAGHDYHPSWPQTVAAVDDFARRHGRALHLTAEHDSTRKIYPSWWVRK